MKLSTNDVWFTADTHYGHSNIVSGVTNWRNGEGEIPFEQVRDFSDVETMNELMVENINQHVQAKDWLIHLGDWSFGGYDKIEEFREKINCNNVVLILGNHDHHIQREIPKFRKMFNHITHYEELRVTQENNPSNTMILCHYPIISWNQMHHGSFMLHGHQHLKGERKFGQGKRLDVGMCGSEDFRPYHIDEVIGLLKNRQYEPYPEHEHHITKNI